MSYVDKYLPVVLGVVVSFWLVKGVIESLGGSLPEAKKSPNETTHKDNDKESGGS